MKESLSDQDKYLLKNITNYPKELFDKTIKQIVLFVTFFIVLAVVTKNYFILIGVILGLFVLYVFVYKPMSKSSYKIRKDLSLGEKSVEYLLIEKKLPKNVIMSNKLNLDAEVYKKDNINFDDIFEGEKYLVEYTPHFKYVLKVEKVKS